MAGGRQGQDRGTQTRRGRGTTRVDEEGDEEVDEEGDEEGGENRDKTGELKLGGRRVTTRVDEAPRINIRVGLLSILPCSLVTSCKSHTTCFWNNE